jgi:hypothetical protein
MCSVLWLLAGQNPPRVVAPIEEEEEEEEEEDEDDDDDYYKFTHFSEEPVAYTLKMEAECFSETENLYHKSWCPIPWDLNMCGKYFILLFIHTDSFPFQHPDVSLN